MAYSLDTLWLVGIPRLKRNYLKVKIIKNKYHIMFAGMDSSVRKVAENPINWGKHITAN